MSEHKRVLVLGGGRVGSAMARDLAADPAFDVTVNDASPAARERLAALGLEVRGEDLAVPGAVARLVADQDLVVGAVPGWMGFRTLRAVLEAGKDVVDISFFEEDPFELDALARERGVTAVVDCGVAPGLSNLVLGRLEARFDELLRYTIYVGGLPAEPVPPWNYKAPYSPPDVIEMYTRPARLRRAGELVTLPALSEPELLDFAGVGPLEAFNTDGLRTPLVTSRVPDLAEKTLRYPGHRESIELLLASGFLDATPRRVGDVEVSPLALSSELLFAAWHQGPTDYDRTLMRLVAEGTLEGAPTRLTYDLADDADREHGISSMARTTGYPATAVLRLVARGAWQRPGVSPPELLGADEACYDAVLADIATRGVRFTERAEPLLEA